jgi:hypothetical protein
MKQSSSSFKGFLPAGVRNAAKYFEVTDIQNFHSAAANEQHYRWNKVGIAETGTGIWL